MPEEEAATVRAFPVPLFKATFSQPTVEGKQSVANLLLLHSTRLCIVNGGYRAVLTTVLSTAVHPAPHILPRIRHILHSRTKPRRDGAFGAQWDSHAHREHFIAAFIAKGRVNSLETSIYLYCNETRNAGTRRRLMGTGNCGSVARGTAEIATHTQAIRSSTGRRANRLHTPGCFGKIDIWPMCLLELLSSPIAGAAWLQMRRVLNARVRDNMWRANRVDYIIIFEKFIYRS